MRIILAFTAIVTLLCSCTSIQGTDRRPSSLATNKGFCVEESSKGALTVCEKMYPTRPYVHVPDTHVRGNAIEEIYGALIKEGSRKVSLVDNAGTEYRLYDQAETPLDVASLIGQQALKKNYTVYHARGVFKEIEGENPDGSTSMKKSIVVQSLRPALTISGCAIDSGLASVWIGKVTSRLTANRFDRSQPTLPIHISIQALIPGKSFEDIEKKQTKDSPVALKDGQIFQMVGEIDNFSRDVHDKYGDFPNLKALGDANPFSGATDGKIKIYRLSSMHTLGDAEFVVDFPKGMIGISPQGMGELTFTSKDFIAIQSPNKIRAQIFGHGSPNGFEMDINPTTELSYEIPCH